MAVMRMIGSAGAALALWAGSAVAQQAQGPAMLGELLDPEVLGILSELGVLEPANVPVQGLAAAGAPDSAALREGFGEDFAEEAEMTLEGLECSDGRCAAVVALGGAEAEDFAERLHAVEGWVSESSPCPYTVSLTPPGEDGDVNVGIVIDCTP